MTWLTDIKKYYIYRGTLRRMAIPVWVLFMIDSGLSLQQIAVIAALDGVIMFLLEIPSGTIADHNTNIEKPITVNG